MNNKIFDTPWKIRNELVRWLVYPFARILFLLNRIPWEKNWKIIGLPIIQKHRMSTMKFGQGLSLRSTLRSNPLGVNHPVIFCTWKKDAVLEIGNDFGMTGGAICATEKIMIGNHVNIGANSSIIDSDFHPLEAKTRRLTPQDAHTAPISIEDDVFIGMNCLILKGVKIGHSSVIGAGSIVTKDIPPLVVACGNPARIIKNISP